MRVLGLGKKAELQQRLQEARGGERALTTAELDRRLSSKCNCIYASFLASVTIHAGLRIHVQRAVIPADGDAPERVPLTWMISEGMLES